MERIDKTLSKILNITRNEAKALIKDNRIELRGVAVKSVNEKCAVGDIITLDGKALNTKEFVYIMMNKPKGVICASDGRGEKTVIDLLPDDMKRKNLFPAGRLDKDTTGFVLITDDGDFAHSILSPKRHIEKTYTALLDKPFDEKVISDFESGMLLGEERLLPARLEALDKNPPKAKIVIKQGIYHQIKRMFKKHKITVLELERNAMGALWLDADLAPGECRYLTDDEKEKILTCI